MSRGRPRHQSSRRRMYSPRQRDLRERRIHQHWDVLADPVEVVATETDDGLEFESPRVWGSRMGVRASAA